MECPHENRKGRGKGMRGFTMHMQHRCELRSWRDK